MRILNLVDGAGRPACIATHVLERLKLPSLATELAQFNLEANLEPHTFGGTCLRKMEKELRKLLGKAVAAAEKEGGGVLLTGILPTLTIGDLGLSNMTPDPRYAVLNETITSMRGGTFHFRIKGPDELDITHENVMLESCNTSFQIHFQVAPDEFARFYNLAQAITAPVLAAAVNSPLLLGRRLWQETRVALFQQSLDARSSTHQARGHRPRVSFGDDWVKESVLEIFREDIARFRVVLAGEVEEDSLAVMARGEIPRLRALCLHNGTVYRWNRPCYGVYNGVPHLRIENRALPAGPTLLDEIANAAFFFGLMAGLTEDYGDISKVMEFDDAQSNFINAARVGLKANLTWMKGTQYSASALILTELLPLARVGLQGAGIDTVDIDKYLGVVEERVRHGQTGSQWMLDSLSGMGETGTPDQRLCALTKAIMARQETTKPVHEWELASVDEFDSWRESYRKVGQFMTTDLFTVRPEDVVDLAASLMDWRHLRHVPVEDNDGRLVGLVSHRSLLRLLGQGLKTEDASGVAVREIMKPNPITVTPETPTLQAIELMRKHKLGCLPVVEGDRLVGIITERDLIRIAAMLFEKHLRDSE